MKPRAIGFLITLKCNAACRHCCFESGPKRTESMSRTQALSYVRQVAEVGYLRGIAITGGEAFLDYLLLSDVIREAGRYTLSSRVVSNCFWAITPDRAMAKLKPLVDYGLRGLSVSYDAVHEEFVRRERVRFAIGAALDLGMEVVVSTVHVNGNLEEHVDRIRDELGLPQHDRLYILPAYIVPSGRASQQFNIDSLALVDGNKPEGSRLRLPCPLVIREPIITPSGDLAACCSPSTATRIGFNMNYVVGNLRERHLADLLRDLEENLIFNSIMVDGPWSLFELVEEQDPHAIKRKKFVNICDLCQQVMGSSKAREILEAQLPERELSLWLRKMSLEAHTGGDIDDHITQRLGLIQMRPQK